MQQRRLSSSRIRWDEREMRFLRVLSFVKDHNDHSKVFVDNNWWSFWIIVCTTVANAILCSSSLIAVAWILSFYDEKSFLSSETVRVKKRGKNNILSYKWENSLRMKSSSRGTNDWNKNICKQTSEFKQFSIVKTKASVRERRTARGRTSQDCAIKSTIYKRKLKWNSISHFVAVKWVWTAKV